MRIEFFDVKSRRRIGVPKSAVWKARRIRPTRAGGTRTTYALRTMHEGRRMAKLCSKADWESLDVPEE